MGETADRMSRQDRIREAYGRAVGDHDHSPDGASQFTLSRINQDPPIATTDEFFNGICQLQTRPRERLQ